MRYPILIEIDAELQPPPVYVRYSHEPRTAGYSVGSDDTLNVDLDAHGEVIGIELVAADGYTLQLAREVARKHGLSLPSTTEELLSA